jgi:DNA-directed RNA polymerase specialized sigma24 family protein
MSAAASRFGHGFSRSSETSPSGSWVASTARLDELRDQPGSAPESLALDPLDWITDHDLMLFVERLPLAQRQVLALRYMLGLTHPEIAQVLGKSHASIRVLHHRALEFLRARLAAVGRSPIRRQPTRMRRTPRYAHVLRSRRYALLR